MPEKTIETINATLNNLELLQENAREILDLVSDETAALTELLRSLGGKRECA